MRVTARGYGIAATGVALLAAGFVFGYPELAALGTACVVALAAALVFVSWRPQLSVVRAVDPDRVMRGEPSRVTLEISNASRFFGASVVARDRCGGRLVPVPLVRLRPGRVTTVSYLVPTTRRGVVPVGPLEITRRDPLGLVGVVRRYGDFAKVWVRPRVHTIAAVPVGLSRSMDGRIDRVPHGSITFAALREYVVGDDLRSVHWRTSARVGELMVREHVDTSLPRVIVLLDARTRAHLLESGTPARESAGESTFEAACEAAASVLVAAVREDVHVTLHLVTGDGPSGATAVSSHAEIGPLLDALAEAELSGPGADDEQSRDPLRATIEQLRARRLGDTLLYLTGPPHRTDLGLVAGLRGAYPSIIAAVFGPVESGLGTTAGMLVVGATDGADFAAAWDGIRAW